MQVGAADCTELTSVKAAYAHYGSEWFDSVAVNIERGEAYAQLRLLFRWGCYKMWPGAARWLRAGGRAQEQLIMLAELTWNGP